MISRIIKDEVCVIHQSRRLRWKTQTEALIILDVVRKPNLIIVLLCIQNAKSSTGGTDEHLRWSSTQNLRYLLFF